MCMGFGLMCIRYTENIPKKWLNKEEGGWSRHTFHLSCETSQHIRSMSKHIKIIRICFSISFTCLFLYWRALYLCSLRKKISPDFDFCRSCLCIFGCVCVCWVCYFVSGRCEYFFAGSRPKSLRCACVCKICVGAFHIWISNHPANKANT